MVTLNISSLANSSYAASTMISLFVQVEFSLDSSFSGTSLIVNDVQPFHEYEELDVERRVDGASLTGKDLPSADLHSPSQRQRLLPSSSLRQDRHVVVGESRGKGLPD